MFHFVFFKLLFRWIAGAAAIVLSAAALAQAYPTKPIKIVVGFAAGSGQDIFARSLASQLATGLGQPVLVDNRPAASGIVAASAVAKSAADGYTLLIGGSWLTVGSLLQRKAPYDPVSSFSSITQLADPQCILFISPSLGIRTVKDFVAYSKANPDKLNYGSAGIGHPFHLAMEMFINRSGAKMTHVPYGGMNLVVNEVVAGRIQAFFLPGALLLKELVEAGKLVPLVSASDGRHPDFPDVPTLKEAGIPDFRPAAKLALVGPAGLPNDIVRRLNQEVVKAISSPMMLDAYKAASLTPALSTPDEYTETVKREMLTWRPLIDSLQISIE